MSHLLPELRGVRHHNRRGKTKLQGGTGLRTTPSHVVTAKNEGEVVNGNKKKTGKTRPCTAYSS